MSANPPPPARSGTRGWVIGRLVGAPIVVTMTWPIAAIVLTALFAPSVNQVLPGSPTRGYAIAFVYALLLFASVLLHEVAHAVVAHLRGKKVHEIALTLWGGQTTYADDDPRAGSAILVSLAGPLTNLVIAAIAWFVVTGTELTDGHQIVRLLVAALAYSNMFVGVFNLVPGLPLDGGQVLEGVVWRITGKRATGTRVAGWIGRVVAVLVVVGFLAVPLARHEQPSLFSIVWALLIASFLWQGASAAIQTASVRQSIDEVDLRVLVHPVIVVPSEATVADVLLQLVEHHARTVVPQSGSQPAYGVRTAGPEPVVLVAHGSRLVASVDPGAMRAVPAAVSSTTLVSAVALPFQETASVDAAAPHTAFTARVASLSAQTPVTVVTEGGKVIGALLAAEVQERLRAHGLNA